MQIVITGANGFVGSNISQALSARGHDCIAVDLPTIPPKGVYSARYSWEELPALRAKLADTDYGLIHLAGKAHDTKNTSDPAAYDRINCGLTRRILEELAPAVFILFSSVKACADRVDGILTEATQPNPKTPYGISKLKAEAVVTEKAPPRYYLLRPAMIHGPGNKGNLNLLYKVARMGIPWPLGAYENTRSFCSIANVSFLLNELLRVRPESGVYQIADDRPVSTNALIRLINPHAWIVSIPKCPVAAIARIGDAIRLPLNSERLKKLTESYVVSNAKIKTALGIETLPVSAEDGLRETIGSFTR